MRIVVWMIVISFGVSNLFFFPVCSMRRNADKEEGRLQKKKEVNAVGDIKKLLLFNHALEHKEGLKSLLSQRKGLLIQTEDKKFLLIPEAIIKKSGALMHLAEMEEGKDAPLPVLFKESQWRTLLDAYTSRGAKEASLQELKDIAVLLDYLEMEEEYKEIIAHITLQEWHNALQSVGQLEKESAANGPTILVKEPFPLPTIEYEVAKKMERYNETQQSVPCFFVKRIDEGRWKTLNGIIGDNYSWDPGVAVVTQDYFIYGNNGIDVKFVNKETDQVQYVMRYGSVTALAEDNGTLVEGDAKGDIFITKCEPEHRGRKLWKRQGGKIHRLHLEDKSLITLSAIPHQSKGVIEWDMHTGQAQRSWIPPRGQTYRAFIRKENFLVLLQEYKDGHITSKAYFRDLRSDTQIEAITSGIDRFSSVALGDSLFALSGYYKSFIKLYDIRTFTKKLSLPYASSLQKEQYMYDVNFIRQLTFIDGNTIASLCHSGSDHVALLDVNTGNLKSLITPHAGRVINEFVVSKGDIYLRNGQPNNTFEHYKYAQAPSTSGEYVPALFHAAELQAKDGDALQKIQAIKRKYLGEKKQ